MTHDNWLYLLEFHVKQNDMGGAEQTIAAMKRDKELTEEADRLFDSFKEKFAAANYTPRYFRK